MSPTLPIIHYLLPSLALVVKLTGQITRREHLNLRATSPATLGVKSKKEKPDPDWARWLDPDRLVPLDAKIKQQAEEVVAHAHAKTPLEKKPAPSTRTW